MARKLEYVFQHTLGLLMIRQVLQYPSVTILNITLVDSSLNLARILQFLLALTEQSTHHVGKSVHRFIQETIQDDAENDAAIDYTYNPNY